MTPLPISSRTNCIYCNKKFEDIINSSEHIISNTLGGIRERRNLLCIDCNTILGKFDKILMKRFAIFTNFYDIKQDRKKFTPKVEFRDDSGEKVIVGNDSHPEFLRQVKKTGNHQETIQSFHSGKSQKIADAMIKKSKTPKKFEKLKKVKSTILKTNVTFGDIDILKSIIKLYYVAIHLFDDKYQDEGILYNFLTQTDEKSHLTIDLLLNNDFLPFPLTHGIIIAQNYNNKKEQLGIVILYNICYLVKDPTPYDNEYHCSAYFLNPITKEEMFEDTYNLGNFYENDQTGTIDDIDFFQKEFSYARIYSEFRRFFKNNPVIPRNHIGNVIFEGIIRGTCDYEEDLALNNIKAELEIYKFKDKKKILENVLKKWKIQKK